MNFLVYFRGNNFKWAPRGLNLKVLEGNSCSLVKDGWKVGRFLNCLCKHEGYGRIQDATDLEKSRGKAKKEKGSKMADTEDTHLAQCETKTTDQVVVFTSS